MSTRVATQEVALAGDPLRSGGRLNEMVFEVLRDHVLAGLFADGTIIRESAVVEAFGVGRAPARMALRRLEREGLVSKRSGHGFVVGAGDAGEKGKAEKAGFVVPHRFGEALGQRNWRRQIYPEVEKNVAACLIYGRFRINQSSLAEHFGVSRTIAHEVLTTLERTGLVRLERNSRWYAGPLTVDNIKESYELRWLLEPEALRQAAPLVRRPDLVRARELVAVAEGEALPSPDTLTRVEIALHEDIVLRCANDKMRTVLRICQLPVISSYGTVARHASVERRRSGVPEMLEDHRSVIDLLLRGQVDAAAHALERHIRRGFEFTVPHFLDPPPLTPAVVPPYMVREG